jgi:hypothetical protein
MFGTVFVKSVTTKTLMETELYKSQADGLEKALDAGIAAGDSAITMIVSQSTARRSTVWTNAAQKLMAKSYNLKASVEDLRGGLREAEKLAESPTKSNTAYDEGEYSKRDFLRTPGSCAHEMIANVLSVNARACTHECI